MKKSPDPGHIQELSDFLLDFAVALMRAGAHTARVMRGTERIASAFGYKTDMSIFQRNVTMTVRHPEDYSLRRTYVKKLTPADINFRLVRDLSALSWVAYDDRPSLGELRRLYTEITAKPPVSSWTVLIATSAGNAAFCRLFGGDLYSVGLVFAATFAGFIVRLRLLKLRVDDRAVAFLSAFSASLIASAAVRFNLGHTQDIAISVSVLYLIPGVPIINSIIDILEGHVLNGLSRAVNAAILIVCIALGVYLTLAVSGMGTSL